jgi:nitronate monooxygenase
MRNRFMDWFGLSAPIVQAPVQGPESLDLTMAVSKAGGLGSAAMTWVDRDAGLAAMAKLKETGRPFIGNFVLRFGTEAPARYLDSGLPAVTFSFGIDAGFIAAFKSRGTKVGVQVGSAAGARAALAAGADFIITQGIEAGGHVQSTTPLARVLAETVAIAGDTPVIAAGGLSTGADVARVMKAGAQGAMLGTRFVASVESIAHDAYKQALVAARAEDCVNTFCFDIGWPYAASGVLRNSTFLAWEAAGNPQAPHRPGEGEFTFRNGGESVVRYSDGWPGTYSEGDVLAGCLYAGTSVDGITSVKPAAEIVSSLWAEARALL